MYTVIMTAPCAVNEKLIYAQIAAEDLASHCSSRCVQMAGLRVDSVLELHD